MSKHTPGPWHVSDGGVIQTNHITRDVWQIPRVEADLTLIAAAPDLLAACEAALEEDCGLQCVDQLRAALAKARGTP